MKNEPEVGSIKPDNNRINVVFPEPFSPCNTIFSEGSIFKFMFSITVSFESGNLKFIFSVSKLMLVKQ